MKKGKLLILLLLVVVALVGCTSSLSVSRLKSSKQLDLSGNWNDTDIALVTKELVNSSLKTNWINDFRKGNRRDPVVVVGSILNKSSEHIDTAIIAKRFEMALINTGRVEMVADVDFRDQVRTEREEQQYYASEKSASALGQELGADFILQRAVRTVVDQIEGKATRTYYVSAELINIETSRKVWVGEHSIKKLIQQQRFGW